MTGKNAKPDDRQANPVDSVPDQDRDRMEFSAGRGWESFLRQPMAGLSSAFSDLTGLFGGGSLNEGMPLSHRLVRLLGPAIILLAVGAGIFFAYRSGVDEGDNDSAGTRDTEVLSSQVTTLIRQDLVLAGAGSFELNTDEYLLQPSNTAVKIQCQNDRLKIADKIQLHEEESDEIASIAERIRFEALSELYLIEHANRFPDPQTERRLRELIERNRESPLEGIRFDAVQAECLISILGNLMGEGDFSSSDQLIKRTLEIAKANQWAPVHLNGAIQLVDSKFDATTDVNEFRRLGNVFRECGVPASMDPGLRLFRKAVFQGVDSEQVFRGISYEDQQSILTAMELSARICAESRLDLDSYLDVLRFSEQFHRYEMVRSAAQCRDQLVAIVERIEDPAIRASVTTEIENLNRRRALTGTKIEIDVPTAPESNADAKAGRPVAILFISDNDASSEALVALDRRSQLDRWNRFVLLVADGGVEHDKTGSARFAKFATDMRERMEVYSEAESEAMNQSIPTLIRPFLLILDSEGKVVHENFPVEKLDSYLDALAATRDR